MLVPQLTPRCLPPLPPPIITVQDAQSIPEDTPGSQSEVSSLSIASSHDSIPVPSSRSPKPAYPPPAPPLHRPIAAVSPAEGVEGERGEANTQQQGEGAAPRPEEEASKGIAPPAEEGEEWTDDEEEVLLEITSPVPSVDSMDRLRSLSPQSVSPQHAEAAWWEETLPASVRAEVRITPKERAAVMEVLGPYKRVGRLGRGMFSEVWLVRHRASGSLGALKVLSKQAVSDAQLPVADYAAREKLALEVSEGAPFIVASIAPIVEDKAQIYTMLRAHLGGELFLQVQGQRTVEESVARFHCSCLAIALDALHQRNLLHRDLKLENIVIDSDGYPCLVDVGSAKLVEPNGSTQTLCGTPEYAAPEMVRGDCYGAAVDWWALGILLYRLLAGELPFSAGTPQEVYNRILYAPAPMLTPKTASLDAIEIVQRLMVRDPKSRLMDLQSARGQAWFAAVEWSALEARAVASPTLPMCVITPANDLEDAAWSIEP